MPSPGGDVGMDRGDLKRMLRLARRESVHAAFALGGDGKPIIILDKRKQPRALEKSIKDGAPDARNTRFGSVLIDPDDPKLARFVINKAASGMARKLIVALKGTGFNKVQIVLEDGSAIEAAEGEAEPDDDDEDGDGPDWDRELAPPDGDDAQAPEREGTPDVPEDVISPDQQATQPDTMASDDAPAPAAAPATPDAATLTKTLTALVKRMLVVIAKDPSQKAALAELAADSQASLKRGDLAQAEAAMAVLSQALDAADGTAADVGGSAADGDAAPAPEPSAASPDQTAPPTATTASTDQPPTAAAPGNGAAATYTKSRMVWMATRQKMDGDIGKLHDAFAAVFKDHSQADALNKAFRDRISTVMEQFDETLAHKLDEIAANTDPSQHAKLVQEAQVQLQRYQSYLASEPLIATLDSNPFTPLAIEKTMTATLTALSKALR